MAPFGLAQAAWLQRRGVRLQLPLATGFDLPQGSRTGSADIERFEETSGQQTVHPQKQPFASPPAWIPMIRSMPDSLADVYAIIRVGILGLRDFDPYMKAHAG